MRLMIRLSLKEGENVKVRLLTDSTVARERAVEYLKRRGKIKERQRVHRSDSAKIETIKTFLALGGSPTLTAGATGIPLDTLNTWRKSNWWKELVDNIRKQEKLELSAKTKKIIDRSMDLIQDRLEQGDWIYDQKKGELIRKPLQAKDINKITQDMLTRKDLLDNATEQQQEVVGVEDKLTKLAEQFAKLAIKAAENKNKPKEYVDVEFVEKED
jgi:hypothetical protein